MRRRSTKPNGNVAIGRRWHIRLLHTLACLFAGAVFLSQPASGSANPRDDLPKVLHVAFSSRVFPDVDQRDARIAMELWARELSRKAGVPEAKVTLFNNPDEIRNLVRRGDIHLVTLPSIEYLAWRKELNMVPSYLAANKCGKDMEHILVVRRTSGISKVAQLKGKTIAIPTSAKLQTSSLWLKVLLLRQGIHDSQAYFGRFSETGKPSKSIMGVFFHQYHAAIVTRGSFETCTAINPQLGKDLAVIAESKSLPGDVSCIPENISARLRQSIDAAAITLHENAVGKQIMTLFHINRVIPYKASYMAGLEDLVREHDALMAKHGKKR